MCIAPDSKRTSMPTNYNNFLEFILFTIYLFIFILLLAFTLGIALVYVGYQNEG